MFPNPVANDSMPDIAGGEEAICLSSRHQGRSLDDGLGRFRSLALSALDVPVFT
jgi:hypothetical protein